MSGLAQLWLAGMLVLLASCTVDHYSSVGFRLPPDGDIERGKVAFITLGCNNCHAVAGVDLPEPTVYPAVPVVLGGSVPAPVTDGHIVTSIIYPAYQLRDRVARHPKAEINRNGEPRMPHYNERMTVRQLTDIVAFLQSKYVVRRPLPDYYH